MNTPPARCYIEISGRCNGRCPYCIRGNGTLPRGGFMASETFENLLEFLERNAMMPLSRKVSLYVWGEPFLHPQIEEILLIAKSFDIGALLSTNLLYLPKLGDNALAAISGMIVSLSGFTQESYGRIHGGKLHKVLNNLNVLVDRLKTAGLEWRPRVNWHRYKFNEHEMQSAMTYFSQKRMDCFATVANLSDIQQVLDLFIREAIPDDECAIIENDIFTHYHKYCMDYYSRSTGFRCPCWNYLIINERCEALRCSGWRETAQGVVLGSVFGLPLDALPEMKRSSGLCEECLRHGVAQYCAGQSNLHFDKYLRWMSLGAAAFARCLQSGAKCEAAE